MKYISQNDVKSNEDISLNGPYGYCTGTFIRELSGNYEVYASELKILKKILKNVYVLVVVFGSQSCIHYYIISVVIQFNSLFDTKYIVYLTQGPI